jgi:hypothetical protein
LDFNRLKLLHLSFELGDFLFQPHGAGLGSCGFLPIGSIEYRQVTADQIEFVDKDVDYAHRIGIADVVVVTLGK